MTFLIHNPDDPTNDYTVEAESFNEAAVEAQINVGLDSWPRFDVTDLDSTEVRHYQADTFDPDMSRRL